MKSTLKVILSLLLIIVLLICCGSIIFTMMFGGWLQTYMAFNQEKLVAEISVTALPADGDLERFEIHIKQVPQPNALQSIFLGSTFSEVSTNEETYTMYGDQFLIGGPLIKFDTLPVILGVETFYKVSRVQGNYLLEVEKNDQLPDGNAKDLNGGVDETWVYLEENAESYPWLVDSAYFSLVGKSVRKGTETYGLYITEDGYFIDEL